MTTKIQDRLLLSISVAAAVISSAWFGFHAYRSERVHRAALSGAKLSGAEYTVAERPMHDVKPVRWDTPSSQRDGKDWIYEVFTPPEIFYDSGSKQFTASPPVASRALEDLADADGESETFGLVLLAVKRAPFRLQLVGYVGDVGEYSGVFEDLDTGEILLARRGRHLPALGLEIEAFDVPRIAITIAESMTTFQPIARAMVRDERSGKSIALSNSERCYTDSMIATVVKGGDTAAPKDVREGDTFLLDGAHYRIGRIQLAPPTIEVERENDDAGDEKKRGRRTLTVFPIEPVKNIPPSA